MEENVIGMVTGLPILYNRMLYIYLVASCGEGTDCKKRWILLSSPYPTVASKDTKTLSAASVWFVSPGLP